MKTKKKSNKMINRREFLINNGRLISLISIGIFSKALLSPFNILAQPAPPSFGKKDDASEKIINQEVISDSAKEISKKLTDNPDPDGKTITKEEAIKKQKMLKETIEENLKSKGYKIQPPKNLKIIRVEWF